MDLTTKDIVNDWVFTFGGDQPNAGCYVTIRGTYEGAREKLVAKVGDKWSFQYPSVSDAGVNRWKYVKVELEDLKV